MLFTLTTYHYFLTVKSILVNFIIPNFRIPILLSVGITVLLIIKLYFFIFVKSDVEPEIRIINMWNK